jgi:membrane-associated phospholipid phosphatase
MRKIAIIVFIILTGGKVFAQNWDIHTLSKINNLNGTFVRNYSSALSGTTPYVAVGIPVGMAVYAGFHKDEKLFTDAFYIGSSVGESMVTVYSMKYLSERERPFDRYPDKINAQSYPHGSSFPSVHTAVAFSLATSLSIRYPKWYVILPSTIWACSIGFSRMNEGVHYPSDIIAGALIGSGCAVINLYVNRWLRELVFHPRLLVH